MNFNGRIIWSADHLRPFELLEIIRNPDFPRDGVAVKLDRLFLTMYGLRIIAEVQKLGVPVFADAKIVEIPSKTLEIAKVHLKYQPWMLNIMAGACNNGITPSSPGNLTADAMYQFAKLCEEAGTKPCIVTVLTSKTPELATAEFGKTALQTVEFYTKLAIDCGITDVVCSPQEANLVSTLGKIDINTPGVRLKDSSNDDQARVTTPYQAIKNGATRLVIGRDLSRDNAFAENYAKIITNIEGGD